MDPRTKNNRRELSRREAMRIMGASAFLLGGVVTSNHNYVKAAEEQPPKFTLSSKTEDGTTIDAEATPNRLFFTVKDNIKVGKSVPLLVLPQKPDDELFDEEKQQKEKALQLLATSGNFVSPRRITLKDYVEEGEVLVVFKFMGEENDTRRIHLTVILKDAVNHTLAALTQSCSDQRIGAKKVQEKSPYRFRVTPINYAGFEFDKTLVDKVHQIDVVFEEKANLSQ